MSSDTLEIPTASPTPSCAARCAQVGVASGARLWHDCLRACRTSNAIGEHGALHALSRPPANANNMMPQIVVESAKFCNLRTIDFLHKPWSFQNECMLEALSANACRMTQAQYAALSADQAMKCCLAAGQWPSRCSQLTGVETDRVLPSLPVRNPLTPITPVVPPTLGAAPSPGVPIAVPTYVPEPAWATHDRPLVQSRAAYIASHPLSLWPATSMLGQIVVPLLVLGILTRIVLKRRRRFQ